MKSKVQKSKKVVDQSELVEFLSEKFDYVDKRFETEIGGLKSMFGQLQGSVDGIAEQNKKYFQEMTMLTGQVRRHDRWIGEIAQEVKIKLKP